MTVRSTRARAWASATWLRWLVASGGLSLAVAGMYLGLYRAKGLRLPVGFDASWYVWRARYVAGHGLGALGTSARPGHEVLSAILGATTGRSQAELGVLLPPVLAGAFAIAAGAVLWSCLGEDQRRWAAGVVAAGSILAATRLVDENVATLLFLVVAVAGLVPLVAAAAAAGRRPGRAFAAAALLLVAAGLAHWLFLAVFGAILAVAVVLRWPASVRQRASGVPLHATESGALAAIGAAVGAAMAVTIGLVLRAPVNTIEVKEDPSRFLPKLRTDAARLALPALGTVAIGGAAALIAPGQTRSDRHRSILLSLLVAWAAVAVVGIAYGAVTKNLPPHRFLELLVVVPGVVALAEAVAFAARRLEDRSGRVAAWALTGAAALAIALPGTLAWYRSGGPTVWIDAAGLREATTASVWIDALPAGRPFVVLVSPFGPAGTLSVPLKERTIRMAIQPSRETDLHLFVGEPADLLAGRRSLAPGAATNAATLPYWLDVRPILAGRPPVVVLKAFAPKEFAASLAAGASTIAPGVAVLRGPATPANLPAPPLADAFPGAVGAAIWTAAVLALLFVAGAGWTVAMLGPNPAPAVLFGLAPAVGAAALMLAGTAVSRAGVGLGSGVGVVAFALTAIMGGGAAAFARR